MRIYTPATCIPKKSPYLCRTIQHNENCSEPPARVAQLVERDLAKVEVASSNLVSRSKIKNAVLGQRFLLYPSFMAATHKCLSTDDEFRLAVAESLSERQAPGRLKLVPTGGKYKTLHARIARLVLDTSHFTDAGRNVGARYRSFGRKAALPGIMVEDSPCNFTHGPKKCLLNEGVKPGICEGCSLSQWRGEHIPSKLYYANDINNDHRLANLRLLYPNCHALTANYRGTNQSKMKA